MLISPNFFTAKAVKNVHKSEFNIVDTRLLQLQNEVYLFMLIYLFIYVHIFYVFVKQNGRPLQSFSLMSDSR